MVTASLEQLVTCCSELRIRHPEIRTRIVYEAVLNIERYMDHTYVATGAQHIYSRGTLPQQYAQHSDNYRPNRPLNVRQIYKSEVLDIFKNATFMGIWQVFQASNVIQHPMHSVYPAGVPIYKAGS